MGHGCANIVLIVAALLAVNAESTPPFRCFRPFKSLDGFSPKFMHRRDNCDFDFLRIENASAELRCGSNTVATPTGASGGEAAGCSVTVRLNATTKAPGEHLGLDGVRYTLKLGKGGKQIHYKGFDGRGFSACCALVDGAVCDWEDAGNGTKAQRVAECPLHKAAGTAFSGTVSRPLHTFVPGKWSAFVAFHRDVASEETLTGRLVVSFDVPDDMEASASSSNAVATVNADDL
uniref:Uncharacterized protein n=1 Tax=Neobodo designis TaxID=312471 RepID=A0A7S1PZ27_NEODS